MPIEFAAIEEFKIHIQEAINLHLNSNNNIFPKVGLWEIGPDLKILMQSRRHAYIYHSTNFIGIERKNYLLKVVGQKGQIFALRTHTYLGTIIDKHYDVEYILKILIK